MSLQAGLVLHNAQVITLEADQPTASFVAIQGDRILASGRSGEASAFIGPDTNLIDCHGLVLIPGFHDAHSHPFAYALSLLGLDCSPSNAPSIACIRELLRSKTLSTPRGQWIRAYGYDEVLLEEGRHPIRRDFDEVTPHHPVRLDHRTGHAAVLNSKAMSALGISRATQDPTDGIIDREESSGQPTGLFLEMTPYIARLMTPYENETRLFEGMARSSELLLSKGITSIQDAGHENDLRHWETFRAIKEAMVFAPRVTMMMGQRHYADFKKEGLGFGKGDDHLRIGPVKIMVTLTTGSLRPSAKELKQAVYDLQIQGCQVAIHAVDLEAVQVAADAIGYANRLNMGASLRHRIEHCSECPPYCIDMVRSSGGIVVTHAGFIYHNGEKYLAEIDASLHSHIYPIASLSKAGVMLASGSDAPVSAPNPVIDIYSAVTRRTAKGRVLSPDQAVTAERSLASWTLGSAYSCFREAALGSIKAGKLADLVLLSHDPYSAGEKLKDITVAMTILGGQVCWES